MLKNSSFLFFISAVLISLVTISALIFLIPRQNKLIGKHLKDVLPTLSANPIKGDLSSEFNFLEGKKVVCFFSLKCVHCRKAAQQLTAITNKNHLSGSIFVFFTGREINVNWFFETAQSSHFDYRMLDKEVLSQLTDGAVPKFFLLEDGIIREILDYEDLNEMKLNTFFENDKSD